uniref:Uncharacterized protein n=1 Tax=Parascaris equorum TaxID=6256 RepID=A0A914R7K1_PAREQ
MRQKESIFKHPVQTPYPPYPERPRHPEPEQQPHYRERPTPELQHARHPPTRRPFTLGEKDHVVETLGKKRRNMEIEEVRAEKSLEMAEGYKHRQAKKRDCRGGSWLKSDSGREKSRR